MFPSFFTSSLAVAMVTTVATICQSPAWETLQPQQNLNYSCYNTEKPTNRENPNYNCCRDMGKPQLRKAM